MYLNTSNKSQVLIIDYMNFDSAAEIPYLVAQAGYQSTVFCDAQSWLIQNKFFTTHIPPTSKAPAVFVAELVTVITNGDYDRIIFVDDAAIRMVNEFNLSDDLLLKILPIKNLKHRAVLGSKSELSRLCTACNIPTPEYLISYTPHTLIPSSFPVLVKLDQSQGGKGVFLCHSEAELRSIYDSLSELSRKKILIQQFLKGNNVGVEAFYDQGVLRAHASCSIKKTVNGDFGVSSERVYFPTPQAVKEIIVRIGEIIGADGFTSISFMYDSVTDTYFLFEFDSRTNGWLRYAKYVGVDFSLALRDKERVYYQTNPKPHMLYHFPRELIGAFFARDIKTFFKWIINSDSRWSMIPWYDLKLLKHILYRTARTLVRRVFK